MLSSLHKAYHQTEMIKYNFGAREKSPLPRKYLVLSQWNQHHQEEYYAICWLSIDRSRKNTWDKIRNYNPKMRFEQFPYTFV